MDEIKQRKRSRLILLLLLAVFLLPLLGSWLLYANIGHLQLGTTNKGEFVDPPQRVDTKVLGLNPDFFAHHQTLVYVSGPDCAADCRRALQVMRATQQALGEQSHAVQRLYLSQGILAADVTQGDPGLTGRDLHDRAVLDAFGGDAAPRYIYLLDGNGYVVLRYALDQDPKFILQDLRHLLGGGEG